MSRKINLWVFILGIVLFQSVLFAQSAELPSDPNVKIGKLSNGMTYYIRKNVRPAGQADFYFAQKVGSILEEESQRGLAHFLEHMAFNGSKHFEGNKMIKYLETIGVKFGSNLNAYTSIDETVYNISSVPLLRESIADSVLFVLQDWSNFITLQEQEIDKERGVVREEWRTRNNAQRRIFDTLASEIYGKNLYGNRMPIGLMDIINNFSYQELRNYYKKWYRPDLQGIIVVGDIDVAKMEEKIKKIFSEIPTPTNPAKRFYVPVENNKAPIISIATDTEMNMTQVLMSYKKDAVAIEKKNSYNYYKTTTIQALISYMFSERLKELSKKEKSPFNTANGGYGRFFISKTKDAWTSMAVSKNGEAEKSLEILLRENERMKRFGFTSTEIERAKLEHLRNYESSYLEREQQQNKSFEQEYVELFLNNNPSPGIEFEYPHTQSLLPTITDEIINNTAKSYPTDTNLVIAIASPKKEGIAVPTKEQIFSMVTQIKSENIQPYIDQVSNEPLIKIALQKGKIVKEEKSNFEYTKWTLSNGASVYFKSTNYKKDEIIMDAFSDGGYSLLNIKDMPNYSLLGSVITLGGIGNFSTTQLEKKFAGKTLSLNPYLSELEQGLRGNASPKDLKTFFEALQLQLVEPRMDEEVFQNFVSKMKNQLHDKYMDPMNVYYDTVNVIYNNHHPRSANYTLNMLSQLDYKRTIDIYKERFKNVGKFSFIFTGAINVDSLKTYVETYLASIPSEKKKETWKDLKITTPKGKNSFSYQTALTTPKSTVTIFYTGNAKYSLENSILMDFVTSVLRFRCIDNLREKKSGIYGIRISGGIRNQPSNKFTIRISFDTNPKLKDDMIKSLYDEIKTFIEKGATDEEISKIVKYNQKSLDDMIIKNSYWSNVIREYLTNKIDSHTTYLSMLSKVTNKDIMKKSKEWFSQGNTIEVVMNPIEKEKKK